MIIEQISYAKKGNSDRLLLCRAGAGMSLHGMDICNTFLIILLIQLNVKFQKSKSGGAKLQRYRTVYSINLTYAKGKMARDGKDSC